MAERPNNKLLGDAWSTSHRQGLAALAARRGLCGAGGAGTAEAGPVAPTAEVGPVACTGWFWGPVRFHSLGL